MDETKLSTLLSNRRLDNGEVRVSFFDLKKESDKSSLTKLLSKYKSIQVFDEFNSWIEESFLVQFPKFKLDKNFRKSEEFKNFCKNNKINLNKRNESGVWSFFHWKNYLIHLLPEDLHHQVITARNKDLISHQEQKSFYKTKIGIAGLSVGQSAAITIATTGGGREMRLADFDKLEGTNLNRIKADVTEINDLKCDIVAKQIYGINPFAKLSLYSDGINDKNVDRFTDGLDIIVDEIDNFHIKALLREKAKEKKLPVVMAFDTADGVVLDVERYDLAKDQKPFFGKLSKDEFDKLVNSSPPPNEIPKFVVKTMGKDTIPDIFKSSILKVGKELAGVPQLGSTAFLAGVAVSYAVKMITSGEKISGRYYIDLRKLTNSSYNFNLNSEQNSLFDKITS